MEINYGIVALLDNKIVHFVGYEDLPRPHDIENLRQELETDQKFGLIKAGKLQLAYATEEIVDYFKGLEIEE